VDNGEGGAPDPAPWPRRHRDFAASKPVDMDDVDARLARLFHRTPSRTTPAPGIDPAFEPPAPAPAPAPSPTPTPTPSPTRPPPPGRARRFLALTLGAVLLVGGVLGAYLVRAKSTKAASAASIAIAASMNEKTAEAELFMTISGAGTTGTVTGRAQIDFAADSANMTTTIIQAGRSLTERVVYDRATGFVNPGGLVGLLVPGKTWVSFDTHQVSSASGSLGGSGGMSGNPTVILRVLAAPGNDVTPLGASTLGGHPVQGYLVHLTAAQLGRDLAHVHLLSLQHAVSAGQISDLTGRVYVDRANRLKRMSALVTFTNENLRFVEDMSWDFSNYGIKVTVRDPAPDQVVPLAQFVHAANARSAPASP